MKKSYLPVFLYTIVAFLILGPLFKPGYILTLDITRFLDGPIQYQISLFGLDGRLSEAIPYYIVAHLMNLFLPQWVTQKIFLFLALFLGGVGAHRLCPANTVGKYFAGTLYMINPFVYVRLLAGQIFFVLSYALIPFAIYYFIALLKVKDMKSLFLTVAFTTLVAIFSIHGFFLVLLAFLVIFIAKIIQIRRDRAYLVGIAKRTGLAAILFLALNAYWLITSASLPILSQISQLDAFMFAPKSTSNLETGLSLLTMYGFWRGGYIYPTDIVSGWWFISILILFLAVYGFVSRYKDERDGIYVKSIAVIGTLALILALGASLEITKPISNFLWEHLFFFRGFRDSHKFIALLVLAYSFLGGLSCAELAQACRQNSKRVQGIILTLVIVVLLLPAINCFTLFNGFWGQIKATNYPQEWHEVNRYLNQDEEDFNVLFLPWHAYMDYSWLPNRDKRLACPARHFFDKPIIQGDNIEIGGIYTQSKNRHSEYVQFLLKNRENIDNLGELLSPLNVKFVILVHEADYEFYDFLYKQKDLEVVLDKPGITLFRNEHPVARIYSVDSVVYVSGWQDYLEKSQSQDVMEHLYLLGNGVSGGYNYGIQKIGFTEMNPVKYLLEEDSRRYTIFTVSQVVSIDYWEYHGNKQVKNLGIMPAFESLTGEGEVVYSRFYRVYIPVYIVFALALVLVLSYYLYDKFRRNFMK